MLKERPNTNLKQELDEIKPAFKSYRIVAKYLGFETQEFRKMCSLTEDLIRSPKMIDRRDVIEISTKKCNVRFAEHNPINGLSYPRIIDRKVFLDMDKRKKYTDKEYEGVKNELGKFDG